MTLEITSGQVYRGKLLEGMTIPHSSPLPPHTGNADIEERLMPIANYSRRQYERPTPRYHSDGKRWKSQSS